MAVIFRYSQTERASLKLDVDVHAVQKQVRPVERQAESDVHQPRGHHPNPRPKITVMNVDVPYSPRFQSHGVTSAQKRVDEGPESLNWAFAAAKQNSRDQRSNPLPSAYAQPRRLNEHADAQFVQKDFRKFLSFTGPTHAGSHDRAPLLRSSCTSSTT